MSWLSDEWEGRVSRKTFKKRKRERERDALVSGETSAEEERETK